jgi:hypothetical protein
LQRYRLITKKGNKVAKKAAAFKGDRSDPKQNKSLAIRSVLKGMPKAKASEVAVEVKKAIRPHGQCEPDLHDQDETEHQEASKAGPKAGRRFKWRCAVISFLMGRRDQVSQAALERHGQCRECSCAAQGN